MQKRVCAAPAAARLALVLAILALPSATVAPPGPAPGRAARPGAPKPAPVRPPAVRPPPAGAPAAKPPELTRPRPPQPPPARLRRPHYWRPIYGATYPTWFWRDLGYDYRPGGTECVITPVPLDRSGAPSSSPVAAATPSASGDDAQADARYVQMQELTDLVHEWRTLNESPALHERLPGPDAAAEARTTMTQIREVNLAFDRMSRQAMKDLAAGRSAEARIAQASECLQKLTALAESLPVRAATDTPTSTRP